MNKKEFVNAVAQSANSTKADAERYINAIIEVLSDAIANGETVQLIGFGSFTSKTRAAHTGINPQTKEKITIPESKVILFKAGATLKNKVNNK